MAKPRAKGGRGAAKRRTARPATNSVCERCGKGFNLAYNQGGAYYSEPNGPQIHLFSDGARPSGVAERMGDQMFLQKKPFLCLPCAEEELRAANPATSPAEPNTERG